MQSANNFNLPYPNNNINDDSLKAKNDNQQNSPNAHNNDEKLPYFPPNGDIDDKLPADIIAEIFTYLSTNDLGNFNITSKNNKKLILPILHQEIFQAQKKVRGALINGLEAVLEFSEYEKIMPDIMIFIMYLDFKELPDKDTLVFRFLQLICKRWIEASEKFANIIRKEWEVKNETDTDTLVHLFLQKLAKNFIPGSNENKLSGFLPQAILTSKNKVAADILNKYATGKMTAKAIKEWLITQVHTAAFNSGNIR